MMKLKTAVSALVILSLLCACTPRDTPQTDPSLPPSQTETQHPEPTSAPELKEPAKEETIPAREETDASETVPSQPGAPDQGETTPAVSPTALKEETPPEETKAEEADPPEYKPEPTEPPQTEPPQTEPPQTEPPQTEPPQTEPPQTEAPPIVNPDTAAIEAYGRSYASSLGFVIDTSMGKGNSGYYSPD